MEKESETQNNPETSQEQNEQQQNEQTQENTEQTQLTNQIAIGPTDEEIEKQSRYTKLLEATLREQAQTIKRFEASSQTPAPAPAPAPSIEAQRQAFYENPLEETRKLLKQELAETIAPLASFVREFRGQSETEKLKARFKNNPMFAGSLTPDVEAAVDQIIGALPPDQVNEQNMQSAIIHAIGLKTMGQLPASSNGNGNTNVSAQPNQNENVNGNQPRNQPMVNPPHMRPSAAPTPTNTPKAKLPPLNENEERLRREQGMTHEEYIKWRDMPPEEVAVSQLGRVKK